MDQGLRKHLVTEVLRINEDALLYLGSQPREDTKSLKQQFLKYSLCKY